MSTSHSTYTPYVSHCQSPQVCCLNPQSIDTQDLPQLVLPLNTNDKKTLLSHAKSLCVKDYLKNQSGKMRCQCRRAGRLHSCAVSAWRPDQTVPCIGVHMRTDQEMCRNLCAHTRRKIYITLHGGELQQFAAIANEECSLVTREA